MSGYRNNDEHCPACKVSLQGDPIPAESQHLFGATHFGRKIGIEILGLYDGIVFWQCPDCQHQWDRFDGKLGEDFRKAYEAMCGDAKDV